MGFNGQLGTVNLADIFQTLQMNRQTGTLTVAGPAETVRLWFSEGQVASCSAPAIDGRPYILHACLRKGLLQPEGAEDVLRRHRQSGQPLRELLLHAAAVPEPDLDEISAWCIEEQVCPTFEWQSGEFSFEEGPRDAALAGDAMVEMGPAGLQTTQVVMEATRRKDEWKRIREVITDPDALYLVDNDGRANLRDLQTDPEMLKVLRYLDGQHTLEGIAQAAGLTRFDTYVIVAQLVVAGVARSRGVAEIIEDALRFRGAGEAARARELLENAARGAPVPEVLKPLAEISAELGQVPRAVELYLQLVQQAQDAGDLPLALSYLDAVVGLSPDDPDLQFERAQVNAELGNVEPAAQGFTAAAQAYLATKAVPKAIDACHRAKNLLPRSPDPHRFLARAYLLDGNTETATVEYKALWHALLTIHRPRQALEQLRGILDADCKYAAVKEQVLSHAQNSEAVRTSRALRTLAYVAIVLLVAGGLVSGWWFYERHLLREDGLRQVAAIEASLDQKLKAVEHPTVRALISELRGEYASRVPEVDALLSAIDERVRADFESRADTRLAHSEALRAAGKYSESYGVLDELATRYAGTRAASAAGIARTRILSEEIGTQVLARAESARRRWTALDWDGALAELAPLLQRKDLPAELRQELTSVLVSWQASLRSARALGERAAAIEAGGDLRAALSAWQRAAAPGAEGDGDRAQAGQRLAALERTLAADLARQAAAAAAQGDAAATFAAVDQLQDLARQARGPGPQEVAASLELAFAVEVDHAATVLAVARPGTPTAAVRAEDGAAGAWRHRLVWRLGETITITASRTGFAPQVITVSAAARRIAAQVALVRGPRWRADLNATPTSPVLAVPGAVLVGTNRSTIEMVDAQGITRPLVLPDSVAAVTAAPALLGRRAFVALDNRIHAVDLAGRAYLWAWPQGQPRLTLRGAVAAAEHELIQGQILLFAAAARGELAVLAVDAAGRATACPAPALDAEITGQMLIGRTDDDRSAIYVPAGQGLVAFDITAVTERNPPSRIFAVRSRGDLIGTPVPATVLGVPCLLVADASGLVLAIDRRSATAEAARIVATWAVDGTQPTTPLLSADGSAAWIATAEGRVQRLDLTRSGAIAWRAPARAASLGSLVGAPSLGRSGLYCADAKGLLFCLDPATGETRWRADLGGAASAGALAIDGRVLVPIRTGQLVCFEEGD